MSLINIVHVSDLHLGLKNAKENWRSLANWLKDKIGPDLVLISGDILDNPDRQRFKDARKLLDDLERNRGGHRCQYLVCAGNHDRHPHGNSLGFLGRVGLWFSSSAAWFDNQFGDRMASCSAVKTFKLKSHCNSWQLAVVGLDTSINAEYSAQGYADPKDLDKLQKTLKGITETDLVIALLHHRLLPMLELEEQRQGADLFKPTVMLNPGTTLRRLAEGNVDLVLHGHEHRASEGSFASLVGERHELVVLAAGSATGAETLKAADRSRASANVIELHPDRSVRLRRITSTANNWEIGDPPIDLLDRDQLGRSRFLRCTDQRNRPTSLVQRYFEFQPNRDILVTETSTDFSIERGNWSREIMNTSGSPSRANVRFEWPNSPTPLKYSCELVVSRNGDHTFEYKVDLGTSKLVMAREIKGEYRWIAGGILTADDLALITPTALGEFRRLGYEFASVPVIKHLRSIRIAVRLPAAFAPSDGVSVWTKVEGSVADPVVDPILSQLLRRPSSSTFLLEIPYPKHGLLYAICWKPIVQAELEPAARGFAERAADADQAQALIETFKVAATAVVPGFDRMSVALYVPQTSNPAHLKRAAAHGMSGSPSKLPTDVSLQAGETLYRFAWYGEPRSALRSEEYENDLLGDEMAAVMLPLAAPGKPLNRPWGLVRVGIPKDADLADEDLRKVLEAHIFAYPVASVMNAAQSG